ncbi:cytochrome P450 4A4-like isoform X2 [Hyla sarda]|uniref:cytochrome P450 4A4-like isoform X2 n=1 Tax=Hyla sarda TaxID=327740 RepID=UPI0024C402E9|nr:cytochrome P450 4A4-like isoform X2 [Hyla sarda]
MPSSMLPGVFSLSPFDLLYYAASLCALYLLYKVSSLYLRQKNLERVFSAFPGPKRHWLYGNVHEMKNDGNDLEILNGYAKQFDYAFPMWFGNFFASLIVYHPDYIKAILSRNDPKENFFYYFLTPWIGNGLLILSGQKWLQHRKLLTPAFHYDVLKPYVRVMSDCVNVMLEKWERLFSDKNPVELLHHVSLMTLDIIMNCTFSYQSDCQNNSENEYVKAVYELSHLVELRTRCFPYHSDFIFHMSPHGFRFRRALRIAHQHTDKVIKLRKESLKEETELEKIKQKRRLDLLDILLYAKDENGRALSDEDLRAEVDTFMLGGHDTTASAISWTLYCLAKYPEHQEKCRKEVREVLGERTTVEWEDLTKLPYTTMCIKEGMRLYSPVPIVGREIKEPITFVDGRSLPKGTTVLISIYCLNRCPRMWDNPEKLHRTELCYE